jgi:hypothetical protein
LGGLAAGGGVCAELAAVCASSSARICEGIWVGPLGRRRMGLGVGGSAGFCCRGAEALDGLFASFGHPPVALFMSLTYQCLSMNQMVDVPECYVRVNYSLRL